MTSMGVLSWRAHETLRKTLESFGDLADMVDEKIIFFNQISDTDREIAAEFGFEAAGTDDNLGIFGGTYELVKLLRGDKIICVQNDNPVCVAKDVLSRRINDAQTALDSGSAQWVRLRNRFEPGFSDRIKYAAFMRSHWEKYLRPFKRHRMLGRAVDFFKKPEKIYPEIFRHEKTLFFSTSEWINYSDQPFMAKRDFMLKVFSWAEAHIEGSKMLNAHPVPEIILNSHSWWRNGKFPVAVSEGVFAHRRFDDSFRKDNAAYNAAIEEE